MLCWHVAIVWPGLDMLCWHVAIVWPGLNECVAVILFVARNLLLFRQ